MLVRFLLGPAGSGKTWRCLEAIRGTLRASPAGAPLLLLAPKQATYQLERQLLAQPDLPGYTRLQILSFDRLARQVVSENAPGFDLLDEEGRVMVLRALLARLEQDKQLRIFHSTARLPGFARQLSLLLRELQQHHLGPEGLQQLASRQALTPALAAKLEDVSVLLRAYFGWLKERGLEDEQGLLEVARQWLSAARPPAAASSPGPSAAQSSEVRPVFRLGALWLDGFAEMTPQELDLLAALVPLCEESTLVFCLDGEPEENTSWLSTWSVVAQSYRQCRARMEALPGCRIEVELLKRERPRSRFSHSPVLAHLEAHWADAAVPFEVRSALPDLRLAPCANPEAEAVLAAHEILRHVRAGGRFRECAVLVRSLEGLHDVLRRELSRYGIPHFLDRREPVAHHPLAELSRGALRTLAYGWRQEDWFGVLKTGLLPAAEEDLDWLENAALEHGWEGESWRRPIQCAALRKDNSKAERLRLKLVKPFLEFEAALGGAQARPTGGHLAAALGQLWEALGVETTLEQWCAAPDPADLARTSPRPRSPMHQTVWDQMQAWLDNLELAFPAEGMPLREWLPIIEAGLSGLTVGVIPPALDQVLVGAVDRSRNPDLRLAIVLGLNEGLFPSPPPPGILLNDADRGELARVGVTLGLSSRLRLGLERYLGYIACTRSTQRLVLAWSLADADGGELKPSYFCGHVKALFPGLREEPFQAVDAVQGLRADPAAPSPAPTWVEVEHVAELAPLLLRNQAAPEALRIPLLAEVCVWPLFQPLVARHQSLLSREPGLKPASLEGLFGRDLQTSVSALEEYAQCPFRFLASRGFQAEERKRFEVDESARGEFQHEALRAFHLQVRAQGRRWRDLNAEEARALIRSEAQQLVPGFRGGVFAATAGGKFQAEWLIMQLEKLITVLVDWAPQYGFDPQVAELGFGPGKDPPPWHVVLDKDHRLLLRGYIDRVDLHPLPGGTEALAAVIDYKSTVRPLDPVKLHHGLQLQLLSYLGMLRDLEDPKPVFGVTRLRPAGVFYVSLGGQTAAGASRSEVLEEGEEARRRAYQHLGRFDTRWRQVFDTRSGATAGDQFKWKLKKDGTPAAQGNEALPTAQFETLLEENEQRLVDIGRKVFAGRFGVEPYRKGNQTACDYCDFRALCRFDPWLQPYRVLRLPAEPKSAPAASPEERP